jgi:integrase
MLAVTWGDVDLVGTPHVIGSSVGLVPTVRITGNIVRVRGGGLVKNDGKTRQSIRTIPLPRFVAEMLRDRRPVEASDDEPVFPQVNRSGTLLGWREPRSAMRYVQAVQSSLGWPWLTSHVFRKTAATILHEAGISERGIGEHIGHTDRATLMNVYLGTADVDPRLVNALDAAISSR